MNTSANVELLLLLLVVTLVVALIVRRVQWPYTLALVIVGLGLGFWHIFPTVQLAPDAVLFLFLPALLFEGAINIDLKRLKADWFAVFLLAVPGLLLAIGIAAAFLHWGMGIDWLTALLLGAIISPTDPVSVLALFRQLGLPERLRTIIEGESLFNDGVGAAIFATLLTIVLAQGHPSVGWHIGLNAVWLMVGGPLIGVAVAFGVARLVQRQRIDDHLLETSITISVAYGVYILSELAHTSGLLAVIGAGIVLRNVRRASGTATTTLDAIHDFWEILGYLANSLLFLLVGIQIGAGSFVQDLPGIVWAVMGVLVGRAVLIYGLLPLQNLLALRAAHRPHQAGHARPKHIPTRWQPILLFSGLRGALSLALVLSLPTTIPKSGVLAGIVYGVVLVTLLGQGIGLHYVLPHWKKGEVSASHNPAHPPTS